MDDVRSSWGTVMLADPHWLLSAVALAALAIAYRYSWGRKRGKGLT